MASNNAPINQDQPEQIKIDQPQDNINQQQFNAFLMNIQAHLIKDLHDPWDMANRQFLIWAFQTWEVLPQGLHKGLINMIVPCLCEVNTPRLLRAVPQLSLTSPPASYPAQSGIPLHTSTNQGNWLYWKLNQLKQISNYDSTFHEDTIDRWL